MPDPSASLRFSSLLCSRCPALLCLSPFVSSSRATIFCFLRDASRARGDWRNVAVYLACTYYCSVTSGYYTVGDAITVPGIPDRPDRGDGAAHPRQARFMRRASYPSSPTPLAASPRLVMVFQIAVTTGVPSRRFIAGPSLPPPSTE